MNHLENEKSPYLRQHRHQPVDWYPWGTEAFTKAKQENKPVLLSIGYSTCHWCHVMAREAFENQEIAQILNEKFISIKVDREERPDIDSVYMRVCQGLTGSGGWPLTIFMTPDQTPFWAGTYLPKKAFQALLKQVYQKWQEDSDSLSRSARQITAWLQQPEAEGNHESAKNLWEQAVAWFRMAYDKQHGGFGAAPKFPSAHNLSFLSRHARKTGDESCFDMVRQTLQKMAQGGIHDQLGGGFSRYSTDEKWLVPHFEKMLYDNALLAMAYSEAGYGDVARQTLDYVLRELTHEEGGFFCGQDADSQGEEGLFYLWTKDEVQNVLGTEEGEAFWQAYHMEPSGIPNLIGEPYGSAPMAWQRQRLMERRKQRYPLALDDKVLTSWNGLMIGAMAQVGRREKKMDYIQAAQRAAEFIKTNLMKTSGRLYIRWRDGEAAHTGQLSDYAYYAYGLLQLYESTYQAEYLHQAVQAASWMEKLFADPAGGYFSAAKDGEKLIARLKDAEDGALPSGNSMAAWVLTALSQYTAEQCWRDAAERQIAYMSRQAAKAAAGHSFFLQALQLREYRSRELICVSADDGFCPPEIIEDVCILVKTPQNAEVLAEAAPFTKEYPIPEAGELYYYCENGSCQAPTASWEKVIQNAGQRAL